MHDKMPRIEREFGVPFPGVILHPDKWTQTALKAMPDGHLDWTELFGRTAPVVLDLGCGNGRSTMLSSVSRPGHDHLGVDTLPVVIRYARKRGNQRGLKNVRFAVIGGHELLEKHIRPQSVAEIHVYHPQPYHDPEKQHLRLITPLFLSLVHRCLEPGGLFVLQTDSPSYWQYMKQVVPEFFEWYERIGRWPNAPKGRTRREIYAMKKGLRVFRGSGKARENLDLDQALRFAEGHRPVLLPNEPDLREPPEC